MTHHNFHYITDPEDAGFDRKSIERAYDVLDQFAEKEGLCGGVALIGRRNGMLPPRSFGFRSLLPRKLPNDTDTIYDCASLTKVVVTTTIMLILIDRGVIRLDDPVGTFLPDFVDAPVTIRHLLTHTSGLPAWLPLYQLGNNRSDIITASAKAPLEQPPGQKVVYSCIGFIVLTAIIETVTDTTLDRLATDMIFQPLQMNNACFNPPPDKKNVIAPTEVLKDGDRDHIVHGIVHDENARAMGGVSGHAGLFATAEDIGLFALMLLGEGTVLNQTVLSRASYQLSISEHACRQHTTRPGPIRGLGWEIKGNQHNSSAGDLMSPRAYGHTGFTGTSLWIDPIHNLFIVLLTNRIHPSRQNSAHIRLRPLFHNAVMSAL